jgi:hypothetical protein
VLLPFRAEAQQIHLIPQLTDGLDGPDNQNPSTQPANSF